MDRFLGPKNDPFLGHFWGPKMAQNGSFWAILGLYTGIYRENRGIWPYMALYRPKMAQNGHFGPFWHLEVAIIQGFWPFWAILAILGQNGPKWPKIGPKTGVLAENGHFWGFWHLGPRGPQNPRISLIDMAKMAILAKKGHFGPSLAWDPGFRGFDPYFRGWPKRHAETTGNGQKGVKIGSKYGPK